MFKNLLKRSLLIMVLLAMVLTVTSCKTKKSLQEKIDDGEQINIGIVQFVTAPPLDDARVGIISSLKDAGFVDGEKIKITVYNPQADINNLVQMAKNAIRDNDLVFAIATTVAQKLVDEADKQGSNVPILFTAVTDPVTDNVVPNATKPGGNVSGTTDMNPVAQQVALLKELNPSATKLGFIYCTSESNSIVQLNLAQTEANKQGITIEPKTFSNANDLKTAIDALCNSGVDAVYLPTDNIVVANKEVVITSTNEHGVPTICGEASFVDAGGTITLGINYLALGKLTGEMAVKLLNKEVAKAGDMAVGVLTNFELVINNTSATAAGINIPENLKNRADRIK